MMHNVPLGLTSAKQSHLELRCRNPPPDSDLAPLVVVNSGPDFEKKSECHGGAG